MQFKEFFKILEDKKPSPRVEVETLRVIIDLHHIGVGKLEFRYFSDFENASLGHFIWGEEERTSAYDDAFNHVLIFLNDKLADDRAWRRFVSAKELMHVFDTDEGKAGDAEKYKLLVNELASNPMLEDQSAPCAADREAAWKAILCLVPPWIRGQYLDGWNENKIDASELAARFWLPEQVVSAAMGPYYETVHDRFLK